MIQNKNIVCMPLTSWDSSFTNTVAKMMSLLSQKNKVLFVDYQYTLKDILKASAGKSGVPVRRIIGVEQRLRKVRTSTGSEIHVLTCPPVFPISWIQQKQSYEYMLRLNAKIIKSAVLSAIKELQMEDVIVINGYNPFMGWPLAQELNEELNVYYCYDEMKGDPWHKIHGPDVEEEYLKKADLVITTSDALYTSKCRSNPNCFVVKNGVDFELFNSALEETIRPKTEKTIGYTGSIDERFDIDTMVFIIEHLKECKFEFAGRVTNEKAGRMLNSFPNVIMHGARKPEEVPLYLKNMDACIIPYLKNEVTKGVYPLKINEYLAAGKPVVMSDFAVLSEFEGLVRVASTKEKFLECLIEEMKFDSQGKKLLRVNMARKNSWQNRVEELSEIIEKFLEEKVRISA